MVNLKEFVGKTITDINDDEANANLVITFNDDKKLYLYAVDTIDSAELIISSDIIHWG